MLFNMSTLRQTKTCIQVISIHAHICIYVYVHIGIVDDLTAILYLALLKNKISSTTLKIIFFHFRRLPSLSPPSNLLHDTNLHTLVFSDSCKTPEILICILLCGFDSTPSNLCEAIAIRLIK